MFAESIEFLNNIGDTCKKLNNVKSINPSELTKALVSIKHQILFMNLNVKMMVFEFSVRQCIQKP